MLSKLIKAQGGINVQGMKNTASIQTVSMPVPKLIKLPLLQHIGQPATAVVAKGDFVHVGSLVAEKAGKISANIHSGVSGRVAGIEEIKMPGGGSCKAVVIESDGLQTFAPGITIPDVKDRESFLLAVGASGVVGLGGAGFPTDVKLNPEKLDKIDTLVINAAECEPFITSDEREMLECGDTVLSGLLAVKKYLNISKVVIGIERNKPEATDLFFSLTKGDPSLSVLPLSTKYPQGAEKVLIQAATGRVVPAGVLPADVGVIMLNVSTVSAIGKYLTNGLPLITRRVTVDGGAIVEPKNVDVIIGTPISDVINACGGFKFAAKKIIVGGPMMGFALDETDYPIIKQNNAVIAFSLHQLETTQPQPCIRCGQCITHCPVALSPVEINEAFEMKDTDALKALCANLCIGCGSCSYVCPAKRLVSPTCVLARELSKKEASKNAAKK